MKSIFLAIVSIVSLLELTQGSSLVVGPIPVCPAVACALPHCDVKHVVHHSDLNGLRCPGCPVCPCGPKKLCKPLPPGCKVKQVLDKRGCPGCPVCEGPIKLPCPQVLCVKPDCPNPRPTFFTQKDGTKCPGCPTCDPPTEEECAKLDRCDGLACAAVFCPGAKPRCQLKKQGYCRVCDSCPKPQCDIPLCVKCDAPSNWVQPFDKHGCPVGCPPCKPQCDVPVCKKCAVTPGWVQPYDKHGCPVGCPPCKPQCEVRICKKCASPPGWVQPFDQHGCPVGCPPCGPVVPNCPWWNRRRCHSYRKITLRGKKCMGCPHRRIPDRKIPRNPY